MNSTLHHPVTRLKPLLGLLILPMGLLNWSNAHATNVNSDCAAAYGTGFVPVIGQVAAPAPTSPRPLKGVVKMDPAFNTCVIRATDHAVEPTSGFARNDYSRRQAFNADNSRFIVYSYDGSWHLYDANTLAYIRALSGVNGDAEPQWDATNPNSLYYVPINGGLSLRKLDVNTNVTTVAADFTSRLPWSGVAHVWTKSEGSPSADGRYWCFMAENSNFGILGVFTYDLQTQTVIGTKSLSIRPDHVSMSASGRYCVISSDSPVGTFAWNPTFTSSRQLHTTSEHSDLALAANGDDVFTFVDYGSDTGDLMMVDLDTGVRTSLFPTYIAGTATAYHISGKAFSKPGWVLMSTYASYGGTEKWLHERIMAVELKANPTIINLAHHHSIYNEYWTEPHASVSRDFTHVAFSSNWGNNSSLDVDDFMIRLPDNLFGGTPPPADTTNPNAIASTTGTSGTITLAATASDNVGVSSVDFMVDGVLKGSDSGSPYSMSLASSTLANGSHSLVAIAYDAAANAGTSPAVAFSINNTTTDTTAPSTTAASSGGSGTIALSATASDNVGVSRVEFWIDGALKGSDSSSPYSLSLDSTTLANGSHSLVSKAYDPAGNVGTSATVSFSVNNTVSDTAPPQVSASVSGGNGVITLAAAASDNVGVSRVEFWIDGVLKGSDWIAPYALGTQKTSYSRGTHYLVAKAYDAAGNVGSSASVQFRRNIGL